MHFIVMSSFCICAGIIELIVLFLCVEWWPNVVDVH